jgi:hypothetical protein
VELSEPIEGGASGGPIITYAGELVGIVAYSCVGEETEILLTARPLLALPTWITQGLLADDKASGGGRKSQQP